MTRGTMVAFGMVLAAAIAGGYVARPYVRAAMLIVRAVDEEKWGDGVPHIARGDIIEQPEQIPTRHGTLKARVYRPPNGFDRTTLLAAGVHPLGIDEPRIVAFARELARAGLAVVTPEIVDLTQFRITPQATDLIEDSASWVAGRPDLSPDGRVGIMGISFSGGLSIVAAGRERLRDRVAFVFSFGGHANLPRVIRYICSAGRVPVRNVSDNPLLGNTPPPHDYAAAVVLYRIADRIVPADQLEALKNGVRTFLMASALTLVDMDQANREFDRARDLEREMPQPAATLMHYVNGRDVPALGSRLLPYAREFGSEPELSPDQSRPPAAPVYLLHGIDDNIIPASETVLLADNLREKEVPVRAVLTALVTHAALTRRPTVREVWELVTFFGSLLGR